jgi:hypothetical protein
LYALEAELAAITAPCLIIAGDEDDPTLEPGLFMKRRIKSAGLGGAAAQRPRVESGGPGAVQPAGGGLLPPGGERALARARSMSRGMSGEDGAGGAEGHRPDARARRAELRA